MHYRPVYIIEISNETPESFRVLSQVSRIVELIFGRIRVTIPTIDHFTTTFTELLLDISTRLFSAIMRQAGYNRGHSMT